MSQKFNDQVCAAMRRIGFTMEGQHWYSSGTITVKMKDGSDDVRVEYQRGRQEGQVKFLDSTFAPSKKTGDHRSLARPLRLPDRAGAEDGRRPCR